MKIVHISHLYDPSEGGVQFWFKNISERLVKNYGDDVTVITTDSYYAPGRRLYKQITPATDTINGVKVERYSYMRWHLAMASILFRIMKRLGLKIPDQFRTMVTGPYSRKMNKRLLMIEADVICGSSSNYYYMQLPTWKKCNFFYFGSIHLNEDESKPALTDLQLRSINASKLYIANTQYEKRRLVKAGVIADKIKVLGVGVDEKAFAINDEAVADFRSQLHLPEGAILIAYAGRIEKTKSIIDLIKGFEIVAATNPNVYLLIAGSESDHVDELKSYCKILPKEISKRIKWKINFDLSEKAALFNSIDVLVLPSANESFGIVFLEAWICKKPVIGTAIGAIKDVISEGIDGLLMKVNDVEDLAEKLARLINSKTLRHQLGENGYNKVINQYTWDIITARLRKYYSESLHSSKKHPSKITADV